MGTVPDFILPCLEGANVHPEQSRTATWGMTPPTDSLFEGFELFEGEPNIRCGNYPKLD